MVSGSLLLLRDMVLKLGDPVIKVYTVSSKVIHSCEHRARVTDERCPWLCAAGIRQTPFHHRGPQAVFSGCPHVPPHPAPAVNSHAVLCLWYTTVYFSCAGIY